jgi:hypothetical protein
MFSEETEAVSPPWGSHPHGAKGLWALGGLTVCAVVGHRTGHMPYVKRRVEAVDKPRADGAHAHQRLNFISYGKVHGRKAKASNRTMGNPAVRHYRGAFGNVAMVEMGSHLAIERARLVTLHLQQARRSSIPTTRNSLTGAGRRAGKPGQAGWSVCAKQQGRTGSRSSPLCCTT